MEFHAKVPVEGFRCFSAVLDLYSNLSELVSIDVRNNQFIMSSLNNSRTAQGLVRISPLFFEDYKLLRKGSPETSMCCIVSNKNFNSLFKKNVDNQDSVQEIQISITQGSVDNERHTEARIKLQVLYKNKTNKKTSLYYTDGDTVVPLYTSDNLHSFVMEPAVLRNCLTRFHPKVTDIIFECTPHTISLKSYWNEQILSSERPVNTAYTISSHDCNAYSVIEPVKVIVNHREFKAYYDFIEYLASKVYCSFEAVGKPVLFKFRHENLIILDLALMTQGDQNENTSGDINMDESTIDSVSTSEIFHHRPARPSRPPPAVSSRPPQPTPERSNPPPAADTLPARAHSNTPQHSPMKIDHYSGQTTIPAQSQSASESAGNSMPNILPDYEEDDDEEPLFRKRPSRRDDAYQSSDGSGHGEPSSSKVSPTGERLTTLQLLRLKHQKKTAEASIPSSDSQDERDAFVARIKKEHEELTADSDSARKHRRLVHKD